MKRILKIFITIIACVALFSLVYWWKCQNEINLFERFSLSEYLPVQALQNKETVAYAGESGDLLNDNFNTSKITSSWSKIWMEEKGAVEQKYDSKGVGNSRCLLIENTSEEIWAYKHDDIVKIQPGDIFEYEGYIRTESKATATLSVVLYDQEKKVIKWRYAKKSTEHANDWIKVVNRFMVPDGVAYIRFRLTGHGVGKAWFDNILFRKNGKINFPKELNSSYVLENNLIIYKLDLEDKLISVTDKRINKEWRDKNSLKKLEVLSVEKLTPGRMELSIINIEFIDKYDITVMLPAGRPEVEYEIRKDADSEFEGLEFPQIFSWGNNARLVVPIQEGMLIPKDFPVDDFPYSLHYGGNLSMAFIGMVDGDSGWMEIVETPNDFEIIKLQNNEGKLNLKNRWIAEKGKFGYNRRIKYCFFDQGSYVAMAKRYQQYAKDKGLFKSLKEKNKHRNRNVNKLIGAADVWFWGLSKYKLAEEMHKFGIEKILFSNADQWSIKRINELGYLTSKIDIYQDAWPPAYHDITHRHDGWPQDLVLNERGKWIKGWTIKKGLKEYQGGVICSIRGLERAKKKIAQDLKDNLYTARFIDTTTASPWRECYHPDHPTTRSEDIKYKLALLGFVSEKHSLIIGSEDGVDVAVPYVDYLEGMMSLRMGRLPELTRKVSQVKYMEPTDNFMQYQIGVDYRIPLWELVYHDCVVSTWHWGDSNNRIPEYWWKKDLFNILYGNMPLWAIRDWDHWKKYKDRFIESYKNVSSVFEKVGFKEMLSHRFVTEDHTVQETIFEENVKIIVNFGDIEYVFPETNFVLPSRDFVVFDKLKSEDEK